MNSKRSTTPLKYKKPRGSPTVEPHKCDHCDYITKQTSALRNHYLAKHASEEERVEKYNFYCKYCKIGFMSPKGFANHLESRGHAKIEKIVADIMDDKS